MKEERGRRGPRGEILPGEPRNEEAAVHLAGELCCFANTYGGGALIVGVADRPLPDGSSLIGTNLDREWLRNRIYELTDRRLTCEPREVAVAGVRLLIIRVVQAVEAIRWNNRIRWRVGASCVEVDAASWSEDRQRRTGYDWSASPSGKTLADVRPLAVDLARRYLEERTGDPAAADLATADPADLLRRLELCDADGRLNVAGALLFVTTGFRALDYLYRPFDGADSTSRAPTRPGSLIEQLWEVEQALTPHIPITHLGDGFAVAQVPHLPRRAVREAIVNGIAHRDWATQQPTVIEHTGDRFVVTSPGGFMPGVNATNIISHPSVPRHRRLAAALAGLRLAELEGIGVDRMVADQIAAGHPSPEIVEIDGPAVRTVLLGGAPEQTWVHFIGSLQPAHEQRNVSILLLVRQLADVGWVDPPSAAPVLQRSVAEAAQLLDRLTMVRSDDEQVVVAVSGVPKDSSTAWRFSDSVRTRLPDIGRALGDNARRRRLALDWARHRGRISTYELSDLIGLKVQRCGEILSELAADGDLVGNRAVARGRGFAYLPADHDASTLSRP